MIPTSGDELVVPEDVAGAETPQRVTELERVFTVVEPEGELVQVCGKMLHAELVV